MISNNSIVGRVRLFSRSLCRFCLLVVTVMQPFFYISCADQPHFFAEPSPVAALELASAEQLAAKDVVPGSYIVTFRGANTDDSLYFSSFFSEYQHHYLALQNEVLADSRIKDLDILTTLDLSRHQSADWTADFDVPTTLRLFWDERADDPVTGVMTRVDFVDAAAAEAVLKEWDLQGRLWFAEPNGISRLATDSMWDTHKTEYTNLNVWWHQSIRLPAAMNTIAGLANRRADADITASPPLIAILDSGTDYEHPQLVKNIWNNGQPGASGCDNDLHGCNTTAPSKGSLGNGEVWPVGASGPGQAVVGKSGHGTHVAGIVAASVGDSMAGVCPVCQVMTVKVAEIESGSDGDPSIHDDSQIRGLKYVTRFKNNNQNAVRIVNSSFGKYSRSRSVAVLVDVLKKVGNGTIVIAAASNEDSMIRSYPAALSNSVAVAALREDNRKAKYSNFGPWVDIAAPGGDEVGSQISSTVPGAKIEDKSGTSMASPVVAGAVGLYLAINPSVDLDTLRTKLLESADGAIYTADSDAARFNTQYYFPQVAGEAARRPLLGSGIIDIDNMFTGARKNAIGKPLDRVTPGCSTVRGAVSERDGWPLALVVLFPLGWLILLRGRSRPCRP